MIFKTSEEWEAAVVSKQKRASWRYGSRCGKRGKGMFLAIFKYIKDQLGFNSSAISLQKARPTTHTWLTPQPLGTLAGTAWRFACNCAAFFVISKSTLCLMCTSSTHEEHLGWADWLSVQNHKASCTNILMTTFCMIDAHNTCVKVLKLAYSKGDSLKRLVDWETTALEIIKKKITKTCCTLKGQKHILAFAFSCYYKQAIDSLNSTDNFVFKMLIKHSISMANMN